MKIIPPYYELYKLGLLIPDLKVDSFNVTYLNQPILSNFANSIYFKKVHNNSLLLSSITSAPEVRTSESNIDFSRIYSWSIGWLILHMIHDPIITSNEGQKYPILNYWPKDFQNILSNLINKNPSKRTTLDILYIKLKNIATYIYNIFSSCLLLPPCIFDSYNLYISDHHIKKNVML